MIHIFLIPFFYVLVWYQMPLPEWKEKDNSFVELHNFKSIFKKVKKQQFVTFVGSSGCGKSVTAYHIALALEKDGYEILQMTDLRDIVQCYNPNKQQVFVVDDFLGIFGLGKEKLNEMFSHEHKLQQTNFEKCKFLMTCREIVFNQIPYHSVRDSSFLKSDNVINFHSDENALTHDDKEFLLKTYGIQLKLSRENLSKTSKMFPLLCNLYANDPQFKTYGPTFFEIPIKCILDQLEKLRNVEKLFYASLVLLALNKNKLTKEMLHEDKINCLKEDVIESCELEATPTNFRIINALSYMTGTYTKNCNDEFSFFHDSMFEIVAYHFGKSFPKLILKHMDSVYIANYIRPKTCERQREGAISSNEFDLRINLEESLYMELATRLYQDIKDMNIYDVFSNSFLKHKAVCENFIKVMDIQPFLEFHSLFLLEQTNISKIVTRKEQMTGDAEKHKDYEIENLLMHEREIEIFALKREELPCEETIHIYGIKVVSWVIYYGHNRILKYIVKRITQYRGNDEDLFDKTNNTVSENVYSLRHFERMRLFFLACCSGDVETVKVLQKYVNKDMINIGPKPITGKRSPEYLPLAAACYKRNVEVVKILLEFGANVNLYCELFETPLIAACKEGWVDLISILIEAGADLDLQGGEHTPLTAACENSHFSIVEKLLQEGADINKPTGQFESPLAVACKKKHVDIGGIDILLKHGAEVNPPVADNTPLTFACEYGNLDVVAKLLKIGASVNLQNMKESPLALKFNSGDAMGLAEDIARIGRSSVHTRLNFIKRYPLNLACESGNIEVVRQILEKKPNYNSVGNFLKLICSVGDIDLLKKYSNIVQTDKTPLNVACAGGHDQVIFELLKADTRYNLKDKGNLELTIASKFGNVKMVKKYLETCSSSASKSENKLELLYHCDRYNDVFGNVLIKACLEGNVFIIKTLLDLGVNVNHSFYFNSPLIAACSSRRIFIINMLLDKGANINQKCEQRRPLTVACENGFCDVVDVLLDRKADTDLQDMIDTPLTAACKAGHIDVVKKLLKKKADVNLQAAHDTPLTAASKFGHELIVKKLIKARADVNLSGRFDTPLIAACCYGYLNIVNMLIENKADVNKRGINDIGKNNTGIDPDMYIASLNNHPPYYCTPLTAASRYGYTSVVESLLNGGAQVDKTDGYETPLQAACRRGHIKVVKKLSEFGASINLKNFWGYTLVDEVLLFMNDDRLQILEMLNDHKVDYSIYADDFPHPFLLALVKHNSKIVKLMLKSDVSQRKIKKNTTLYNVLVDLKKGLVKSDYKDDVILAERKVWCLNRNSYMWKVISSADSFLLQHLFNIGLNVNQSIKLYDKKNVTACGDDSKTKETMRPLLFLIIDADVCQRVEKVRTMLKAGVDLSVRVTFSNYCSLLDKDGVTVLERTRRLITSLSNINSKSCKEHVSDLKKVMREIKIRTRRFSV